MTFRQSLRFVVLLLVACIGSPALAAERDAATLKKIDDALKVHFPAEKYTKAENLLRTAIQSCGFKLCSGDVLAKAHVALGVVRAKVRKDVSSARKAFENAKKADPNVAADVSLAEPAVRAEFYKVMGRPLPPELAKAYGSGAPVGNLHCTPATDYEIQTAQPIAVVCDPLEGVVRAELHYRVAGADGYTSLLMSVEDGTLRANIPCEPLTKPGKLQLYVIAQDFNKEKIDTFGSASSPAFYRIVNSTKEAVPSYPGQDPPKRCNELLVGVVALGEACTSAQPCKHGLYCGEGFCKKALACESNSDCESEECNNGYCAMERETPDVETTPNKFMFGLHGGLDLWLAGKWSKVCGEASLRAGDFYCYNSGADTIQNGTSTTTNSIPMTDTNAAGMIDPGFRLATVRVMASADYVLKTYLSVGVRLGWAFNGGPKAIHYNSAGTASQKGEFIPVHAEARGTLWLRSLGKKGLHPSVHVSLGMAQVDANTPINAKLSLLPRKLDAWHRMGPVFAGAGFGALYSINKTFGVQLDVNGMFMLPKTGIVVEPSLGGVVGF